MIIVGIQKHHNSSACLYIDGKLIYYNQEDRLTRKKYDCDFPLNCLLEIVKIKNCLDYVLFTGYDFNGIENNVFFRLLKKIGFTFNKTSLGFNWYSYHSHHLIHAAKSFYSSKFSEALIVVRDGRGAKFFLPENQVGYETTTVFKAKKQCEFEEIFKRFHSLDSKNLVKLNEHREFCNKIGAPDFLSDPNVDLVISNQHDVGHAYTAMSMAFGFKEEGKLMGLHSYGSYNENFSCIYDDDSYQNMFMKFDDLINYYSEDAVLNTKFFSSVDFDNIQDKNSVDLAHATQKWFEKSSLGLIKDILKKHNCNNLILTGGCALNVVANNFIRKNLPDNVNLYVDPLCGDEGNCIGVVELFQKEYLNMTDETSKNSIYICSTKNVENLQLEKEIIINNVNYYDIVELLVGGEIVAIFQGFAEAGPRALGNRSLLFDPRIINGKDIVNTIKKREQFRPFACSVMLEHAHNWFNMNGMPESPFMMYAFDVIDDVKDLIPAVVHVDGSCRVQTVTEEQNLHLYNLLDVFFSCTGVPLLLNTSFNLAGDPLVHTIEDALLSLRNSQLKYIYLPETEQLIKKVDNVV